MLIIIMIIVININSILILVEMGSLTFLSLKYSFYSERCQHIIVNGTVVFILIAGVFGMVVVIVVVVVIVIGVIINHGYKQMFQHIQVPKFQFAVFDLTYFHTFSYIIELSPFVIASATCLKARSG